MKEPLSVAEIAGRRLNELVAAWHGSIVPAGSAGCDFLFDNMLIFNSLFKGAVKAMSLS
jgi:hypothetical protein